MNINNPLILTGTNINEPIKNIITDENKLVQLVNRNYDNLSKINYDFDPNTVEGINQGLKVDLLFAPLKLGCCLRDKNDDTADIL
jgi:hypothetical protein